MKIEQFGAAITRPAIKTILSITGWSNFDLARRMYWVALILGINGALLDIYENYWPWIAALILPCWFWLFYRWNKDLTAIENWIDHIEQGAAIPRKALESHQSDKYLWTILTTVGTVFLPFDLLIGSGIRHGRWPAMIAQFFLLVGLFSVSYISPRKKSWARQAVEKLKSIRISLPSLTPAPVPT